MRVPKPSNAPEPGSGMVELNVKTVPAGMFTPRLMLKTNPTRFPVGLKLDWGTLVRLTVTVWLLVGISVGIE